MESQRSKVSIFSGISKAYLEDKAFRNEFYTYDHADTDAWYRRKKYLTSNGKVKEIDREMLCKALTEINTFLEAGTQTIENIEKLKNEDTLCVVTGQQTGLLGGPLYTIYKAITAIKEARAQTKKLGQDVVPVFWMASEDHDFEEVRHMTYIDENKMKTVKVNKMPGSGQNNPFKTLHNYSYLKEPVGWVDVNTSSKSALLEIQHVFKGTKYEAWCRTLFVKTLKDNETMSAWFGRIMAKLFYEEGLIIIDPLHKGIRALGKSFLKEAVEVSQAVIGEVKTANEKLLKEGFDGFIKPMEGATGLYLLERGERLALTYEGGMYGVREGNDREAYTLEKIQVLMDCHPEEFSTNVILRPVIQDVYLPTLAYVAGPGEAAYYAQLKHVYGQFNMEMPIILPRENFTVVRAEDIKTLGAFKINLDDILMESKNTIETKLLKDKDSIDVEQLFEAFQSEFDQKYDTLVSDVLQISDAIGDIADKNRQLIYQQFDYLKQKSLRFHRKNHRSDLKTVGAIYDWIKPYGKLQERTLGFVNILSEAGPEIIKTLTCEMPYSIAHRVIVIDNGEKNR